MEWINRESNNLVRFDAHNDSLPNQVPNVGTIDIKEIEDYRNSRGNPTAHHVSPDHFLHCIHKRREDLRQGSRV